jgi:hypothetical protein
MGSQQNVIVKIDMTIVSDQYLEDHTDLCFCNKNTLSLFMLAKAPPVTKLMNVINAILDMP